MYIYCMITRVWCVLFILHSGIIYISYTIVCMMSVLYSTNKLSHELPHKGNAKRSTTHPPPQLWPCIVNKSSWYVFRASFRPPVVARKWWQSGSCLPWPQPPQTPPWELPGGWTQSLVLVCPRNYCCYCLHPQTAAGWPWSHEAGCCIRKNKYKGL